VTVKQAANVIDLLEYFAAHQRPATLAEVSKHFAWPRSSAFNLLTTLTERGVLYEPHARGGYYPAPALGMLVQRIERAHPIPPALQRLLEMLVQDTGETAVLAAPSGASALFIAAIESPQAVRYSAAPGKRTPLHVTATGRALLSLMTDAERTAVLRKAQFVRHTPTTLMTPAAVEKEIERASALGHFPGNGEFTHDLGGVAVPLAIPGRYLAVLVAGPKSRVAQRLDELARTMKAHIGKLADV
jgi:IclR family acetate operon transcriptional repressor